MSPKHQRTSSQGKKLHPPTAKPKAPGLSRRGHSHGHLPLAAATASTGRPLLGGSRKTTTEIVDESVEEDSGTASFPQFCTTCERQIVSPGSNILYCSEACREKDSRHSMLFVDPLSFSPPLASSFSARSSYFDSHPRQDDILPRRSPTVLRPVSMAFSDVSNNDDDPTYRLESSFEPPSRRHHHRDRSETEASRYLSLFKSNPSATSTGPTSCPRPSLNRQSTATDGGIPSLSHTPSSSLGTAASDPNSTSYRPLPPRHEPQTSLHHPNARKSIDLVTPAFSRLSTHHHPPESTHPTHSSTQYHQRKPSREPDLKSAPSTMTSFYVAEAEDVVSVPTLTTEAAYSGRRTSWRPWNDDDTTTTAAQENIESNNGSSWKALLQVHRRGTTGAPATPAEKSRSPTSKTTDNSIDETAGAGKARNRKD